MKQALILLSLLWLAAGTALAGPLDDIRARGVLRVAVKNEGAADKAEHNDPAHFQKRDFELALAGRIAERILGDATKVEVITFRRPERLPAVADGRVDIGISMFAINAVDAALVDFSEPYYETGLAIMHRPGAAIGSLADLDGLRLVSMEKHSSDPGGALLQLAEAAGAKPQIRRVSRFEEGARQVAAGEADGFVAMHADLDVFMQDHPGFIRSPLLSQERMAVAVRKGNGGLLETVNAVIGELKRSGKLDEMMRATGLSRLSTTAAPPAPAVRATVVPGFRSGGSTQSMM